MSFKIIHEFSMIVKFGRRKRLEWADWVDNDVILRWTLWAVLWQRSLGLWVLSWWRCEVFNWCNYRFCLVNWSLSDYMNDVSILSWIIMFVTFIVLCLSFKILETFELLCNKSTLLNWIEPKLSLRWTWFYLNQTQTEPELNLNWAELEWSIPY